MMHPRFKIAAFLVLTAFLIVVVKLFVPEPLGKTEEREGFWLNKTHTNEQFEVVVGGDSRIYRGFSVEAMLETAGNDLTALNMGYSSAGFSDEYLDMLLHKLKPEGERYLVLGVSPHSLTGEAAKNEFYHEYLDEGLFTIYKWRYLSGVLKFFSRYTAEELRDHLFKPSTNEGYFEEYRSDGWTKSYKIPEDSLTAVDIYRKTFTDYQVSDSLVDAFMNRVSKIEQAGIEVIAFRPPTFSMMTDVEDSLSGFAESDIRKRLGAAGCTWVDLDETNFHTYDGSHLHFESAEKLGRIIGERIQGMR